MLIDGLKCDEDFILFRKRHVLSQILSLYSSAMLDQTSKVSVVARIGYMEHDASDIAAHSPF